MKPNPKRGPHRKYNWDEIRKDYVENPTKPSIRELEKKYGCPHGCIQLHCREERWVDLRSEHWHKSVTENGRVPGGHTGPEDQDRGRLLLHRSPAVRVPARALLQAQGSRDAFEVDEAERCPGARARRSQHHGSTWHIPSWGAGFAAGVEIRTGDDSGRGRRASPSLGEG